MLDAMTQEIERRITTLHLDGKGGECVVDFEQTHHGWTRIGADTNGGTTGERTESHVQGLAKEVEDFVAAYSNIDEAKVVGVSDEEFLDWVRPMLDERQDSIVINGETYDVYEEQETV